MSNELEHVNVDHVSVEQRDGVRSSVGARTFRGVGLVVGLSMIGLGVFGGGAGVGSLVSGADDWFNELLGEEEVVYAPVNPSEVSVPLQDVTGLIPEIVSTPGVVWFDVSKRTEADGEWVRVEGELIKDGEYGFEHRDGTVQWFVVEPTGLVLQAHVVAWSERFGEGSTVETDKTVVVEREGEDGRAARLTVDKRGTMLSGRKVVLDVRVSTADTIGSSEAGVGGLS